MAGDPPNLLYKICDDLRVVTLAALAEGGCDPVDRAYVEIGTVLAPVEFGDAVSQLTVTAMPLNPDLGTDIQQRREGRAVIGLLWKSKFTITLLRPYPMWSGDEGSPLPSPDVMDAEARKHYADAWQIGRVLAYKWNHKELVRSFPMNHENTQWTGITTRTPAGGIRGLDLTFTVSIHDLYVPEVVTPAFSS